MEQRQGFEIDPGKRDESRYVLRLYVTGASPNSSRAITNLTRFLEKRLRDRYELEIVDVYQQPHIAKSVDIIALPLLVRVLPQPSIRLIGDMSNSEKLLRLLAPADFAS